MSINNNRTHQTKELVRLLPRSDVRTVGHRRPGEPKSESFLEMLDCKAIPRALSMQQVIQPHSTLISQPAAVKMQNVLLPKHLTGGTRALSRSLFMNFNGSKSGESMLKGRWQSASLVGHPLLSCLSTDLHTLICILDLPVSSMGIGNSHRHCRVIE